MAAVDLPRDPRRSGGAASSAPPRRGSTAPDYHALGTFAETWAFLELFVDRCVCVVGDACAVGEGGPEHDSLAARLDALDTAVIILPALSDFAAETTALTADVRALTLKRKAVLQDVARASLNRLGMNLFEIPDHALGPNAIASPFGGEKALDVLHLKTCELVRRSLLLLNALEARLGR